jgi:hypothetical protein
MLLGLYVCDNALYHIGDRGMPDAFDVQPLHVPPLMSQSQSELNPAEWMHERLVKSIATFEEELDKTKEIGARLVNFGPSEAVSIENVSYWGPDLIIFQGTNIDGHPVELLQHYTQVNVLLVAVPAKNDPPRRIGFILEHKLQQKEDGE